MYRSYFLHVVNYIIGLLSIKAGLKERFLTLIMKIKIFTASNASTLQRFYFKSHLRKSLYMENNDFPSRVRRLNDKVGKELLKMRMTNGFC